MSANAVTRTSEKPITVNLETLESSEVRDKDSLIFRDKMGFLLEKIVWKVHENVKALDKRKDDNSNAREDEMGGAPSCFLIDGARGSGKSTLMRAVRYALVNKNQSVDIYPLADVDPTELGKGENFFLYLLGRIYNIIDKQYKHDGRRDENIEDIRAAGEALRKMSGGLQRLMDADDALKKTPNPEFFLEECIEQCADSSLIRNKLTELLDKVAKIVRRNVFLVTIDDADLNFSKCADLLEYVRKYMQSPRLVFLFAGDINLFTHVVRGMYVRNFSDKQLKYDTMHEASRLQMVKQLVDQYLQKFFPVDYRVQTDSLKTITDGDGSLLIKNGKSEDDALSFDGFLYSYLLPIMEFRDARRFRDELVELPMRSVFLFLRYLGEHRKPTNAIDALKIIEEGLKKVVATSLVRFNVDALQLGSGNLEHIQKTLFQFFCDAKQWNSDLSMLSAEPDDEARQVALYLGVVVGKNTLSLGSKISYWCACFPAWQAVRELYMQTYDAQKTRDLVGTCLKLGNSSQANAWANLGCSAMAPSMSAPSAFARGTIGLFNEDRLQDKENGREFRHGLRSLMHRLEKVMEEGNEKERTFVFALNSCLCRLDDTGDSHYYFSVYHLLMQIAEWMNLYSQMCQATEIQSGVGADVLLRQEVTRRLSAMRVVPSASRLQGRETRVDSYKPLYHVYKGEADESFVDELCVWIQTWRKVHFVSTASDFSRSWETFMAKCSELTALYQTKFEDEHHCPKAGEILQKYMESVEIALSRFQLEGESKLVQCVTSFPLWKILRNPPSRCLKLVNAAYVGDYIDERMKRNVASLKAAYHAKEVEVQNMAERHLADNEKYEQSCSILKALHDEMEIKEKENSLHQLKIHEIKKEVEGIQKKIEKAMQTEEESAQNSDLLSYQESSQKEQRMRIEQKWQLMKLAVSGDSVSFEVLNEEMKKVQSLMERAKTEKTRQKHESTLELLMDIISLLKRAEKENKVQSVWKEVCNEKEQSESGAAPMQFFSLRVKSAVRSSRASRERLEKTLSEMIASSEPFRKMAFEAEITYEISKMKYERMMSETDELKSQWLQSKQKLSALQQECGEAKQAYDDAIRPDEGE